MKKGKDAEDALELETETPTQSNGLTDKPT
jgi:hypothetical protein